MTYSSFFVLMAASIFTITLSACSGSLIKAQKFAAANPAPIIQYGASPGYGSRGVHTVLARESLASIARYYDLLPTDIAAENNLSPATALKKGMRLILPPPKTYQVRTGDTAYSIARLFGIDPQSVISQNGPRLRVGQDIKIAHFREKQVIPLTSHVMPSVSDLAAPVTFVTQSQPPFQDTTNARSVQVATLGPVSMTATPRTGPVVPGQKPSFTNGFVSFQAPTPTALSGPDIIQGPVGRSGFSRPVVGPILSTYGPKSGGLYNEGVNIAAPKGTAVRAAGAGTIVYTGNAVEGYGNLILLKHPNGYITTYAHLDKTLVRDGQIVQQGQAIGTVGSTGSVKRSQLHFEIRKGRESINPVSML